MEVAIQIVNAIPMERTGKRKMFISKITLQ